MNNLACYNIKKAWTCLISLLDSHQKKAWPLPLKTVFWRSNDKDAKDAVFVWRQSHIIYNKYLQSWTNLTKNIAFTIMEHDISKNRFHYTFCHLKISGRNTIKMKITRDYLLTNINCIIIKFYVSYQETRNVF